MTLEDILHITSPKSKVPGILVMPRKKFVAWVNQRFGTNYTLKGFNLFVENHVKKKAKIGHKLFVPCFEPNCKYLRRSYIRISVDGVNLLEEYIQLAIENPCELQGFEQKAIDRETKYLISRLRSHCQD